jgi:plasmid stability protein
MASVITVRNLDEGTQRILRHRAVDHGVSFEAELRSVLEQAASQPARPPSHPEPTGLTVLLAAAAEFRAAAKDLDFTVERIQEYPGESPFDAPAFQ